jgi:hypothetical protein
LQCVKCAIRHDLLFWEAAPSSKLEADIDEDGELGDDMDDKEKCDIGHMADGWDAALIEDEDDGALTVDMDTDGVLTVGFDTDGALTAELDIEYDSF